MKNQKGGISTEATAQQEAPIPTLQLPQITLSPSALQLSQAWLAEASPVTVTQTAQILRRSLRPPPFLPNILEATQHLLQEALQALSPHSHLYLACFLPCSRLARKVQTGSSIGTLTMDIKPDSHWEWQECHWAKAPSLEGQVRGRGEGSVAEGVHST